uniref:Uncharacterized protein n=1 Tax=Lotus japonicus TaxID=34305 RepID=I3SDY5_LOTJA|nr:unknown [Lotus japonicus]
MKTIDIFCASQASTAICLSTDQPSSSSSSISSSSNTIQFGGRAIDRHNPIITDPKRTPSRDFTAPSSSSQPPPLTDPKPSHDPHKAKKNTIPKPGERKKKKATKGHDDEKKKKKCEAAAEKITEHITNNFSCKPIDSVLRRSWVKPPSDLNTPPGSSRYLLGGSAASFDFDPVLALAKVDTKKAEVVHGDETNHSSKRSGSSVPKSASPDQVVVLRVSLHCKVVKGKVRKHLSRMQVLHPSYRLCCKKLQ